MNRLLRFFAAGAGLGYLPSAPGTWGSAGTVVLFWFLPEIPLALSVPLIIILTVAGAAASAAVEDADGIEDPGWIVIDEVVGQWIALAAVPHTPAMFLAAFILFRIFDITKPWIIDGAQSLGRGWGVMMDDVLAGFASAFIIQLYIFFGGAF